MMYDEHLLACFASSLECLENIAKGVGSGATNDNQH
jgi:hypothetical protein